jgi:2,3-bisphosphoglycerate-independent phosphoglycerate mutase
MQITDCETINPDGSPNTAHTTNPVPIILVDKELKKFTMGLRRYRSNYFRMMGIENPVMILHLNFVQL